MEAQEQVGEGRGRRPGRPMDRSLDDVVLSTTLDLLADLAPDRVTLDEVASRTGRAKTTLYRRWATKNDLILAAVHSLGSPPEVERLPDRGSLRADLLAVVDSAWLGGPTRRLALFAGLGAAARSVPGLREVVDAAVTEPYVDIYRRLLLRAIERGEVPERVASSVDVLAAVIPAMSSHRLESGGVTPGRDYYVAVVDDVVLAAVRGAAG